MNRMAKTIILLIEDVGDIREKIKELLMLAGYNVIIAANGKDGLDAIHKNLPDLVLCDIQIPGLDGYGVMSAIKNIPHMIGVPFVFMTSKSDPKELRKGMNMGADDFLVKPFTNEELLNVVSNHLKKSGLMMEKLKKESKKIESLKNDKTTYMHIFDASPYKAYRKIKAKQLIYLEGDEVNFIYCLVKGKIKTFKTNGDGKDIITGL